MLRHKRSDGRGTDDSRLKCTLINVYFFVRSYIEEEDQHICIIYMRCH